ncbi:hypothetical protein ACFLU6_09095 [Acidobacteriota bacterium]
MKSKKIKLSTGAKVELDGDLVFLVDRLYREIAVKQGMEHSYQDLHKEIQSVASQMSREALEEYFLHSLFLNYVTYENEMVDRLMAKFIERGEKKRSKRKKKS